MKSKNLPKIVYYLGAGASYYSFPIVDSLQFAMQHFYGIHPLNESTIEGSMPFMPVRGIQTLPFDIEKNSEVASIMDLYTEFYRLGLRAISYRTVDTLAYTYFRTYGADSENFKRLKAVLNSFFIIWQLNAQKVSLNINRFQFSTDHQKSFLEDRLNRDWQFVDGRYLSLFSSLLSQHLDNKILIPGNVNFISWNYDLQLELALKMLNPDSNLENIIDTVSDERAIIHLNGLSGYINDELYVTIDSLLSDSNDIELLKKISQNYKHILGPIESFQDNKIRFAFENTTGENSLNITYCREIMADADFVVIMGYSFPTFNRLIDLEIFEGAKLNKKLKIIVQNPNFSSTEFKSLFPYFGNVKDISADQFYIPPEYWSILNS